MRCRLAARLNRSSTVQMILVFQWVNFHGAVALRTLSCQGPLVVGLPGAQVCGAGERDAATMRGRVRIGDDQVVELAEMFRLMSDPTRLKIILACLDHAAAVGEMADRLGISASLVSHHLRLLQAARLLQADRRGRQVFYAVRGRAYPVHAVGHGRPRGRGGCRGGCRRRRGRLKNAVPLLHPRGRLTCAVRCRDLWSGRARSTLGGTARGPSCGPAEMR
ncbi:metalloregulator ArsR/SmtB family transcription factor [Dankookia sp. P2]|uniref:metalloregulator ArsR/SmtB family transcription factor n=1 Tax=Dankookia sp. P2 TaxID=3423955 RepID=UPI003D676515